MFLIFTYRIIIRNEHSIVDVPFNKGEYSHDNYAFVRLFSLQVLYDEGISNHSSSSIESKDLPMDLIN